MKSLEFGFLWLLITGVGLFAQNSAPKKEAPPDPPLIVNAPANSQWTITYTLKVAEKEPNGPGEIRERKLRLRYSPLIKSKLNIKGSGQMVIYTNYEGGLKSETWVLDGQSYELPMRPGDPIKGESRGKSDFSEIYWVTPENFRGTVDFKGRKLHLYETDLADSGNNDPKAKTDSKGPPGAPPADGVAKIPSQRAYIDAQTRLPVSVDAGSTVWSYQFAAPPQVFPKMDEQIARIQRDAGVKTAR